MLAMTNITNKALKIDDVIVRAYKIPAEQPESDGTLKWDSTTMVLVSIKSEGETGIGYTYADASAGNFIENNFSKILIENNPLDIEKIFTELHKKIRNNGNCGIAFMALSAVDIALWDLKSKLLDLPLSALLGRANENVLLYASGGFTSYSEEQLATQMENWSKEGFKHLKIKIGREPEKDLERIRIAHDAH